MAFDWGGAGSGAMAGAELGSFFPGWGTGIGAVAGGIFGGLFGKKKSSGGGGGFDLMQFLPPELLSGGQEDEVLRRLFTFNDTPDQPMGQLSRQTIMDRLDPNYVPRFFRDDILNPFLQAQFRLGREQLGRDTTAAQEQFQRMGAYFSPDLPDFIGRLTERQNLSEQDFLGNLGFRGAELAETLRTDALARALGLEQVTQGGLEQLIALNNQRYGLRTSFLNGGVTGGDFLQPEAGIDPYGFIAGGGLDPTIQSIMGSFFNRSGANGGYGADGGGDFLSLEDLIWQNQKKAMVP